MISIPMVFTHDPSRKPKRWPVTRGVPLPEGMLRGTDGLSVAHPDGARVPTQFRVIGHWSDGSVKWVLVDFQADADPSGRAVYTLMDKIVEETLTPQTPSATVSIVETEHDLHMDTGALRFRVGRRRYGLFHSVSLAHVQDGEVSLTKPVSVETRESGPRDGRRGLGTDQRRNFRRQHGPPTVRSGRALPGIAGRRLLFRDRRGTGSATYRRPAGERPGGRHPHAPLRRVQAGALHHPDPRLRRPRLCPGSSNLCLHLQCARSGNRRPGPRYPHTPSPEPAQAILLD